jgi:hypothetical protein
VEEGQFIDMDCIPTKLMTYEVASSPALNDQAEEAASLSSDEEFHFNMDSGEFATMETPESCLLNAPLLMYEIYFHSN